MHLEARLDVFFCDVVEPHVLCGRVVGRVPGVELRIRESKREGGRGAGREGEGEGEKESEKERKRWWRHG